MSRYLTIFKRAAGSFGSHHATSFAAAIAYNTVFSIFPLILFVLGFLGYFIHSTSQRQSIVNNIFNGIGGGVSKGALATQVNAIAGGSGAVGIVGLIIAAWSASSVFSQIRTSLNVIWNSTKSRPLVQGKLLDLGMVVGIGLLLLLSIAVTGVLTALQNFDNQIFGTALGVGPHILFAVLYALVPTAIAFVAFSIVYRVVPHAAIRFKDVWLGALTAAILFEAVQLLFAYYVAYIGNYNKTYGTLAGIIAFLFFVYLSANIILFGAEVAKEHVDVVAGMKPQTEPQQPQPKQSIEQRVWGMIKGLFVDTSPHHDTSLPNEPGRNQPERPAAELVTDEQSHSQMEQAQREQTQSDGQSPTQAGPQNGEGARRRSK